MHGCFYHLCSNMWKRIQQSGLQERYINDPEFALHLRMISALEFVPPNDVQNSFGQLAALIRNRYGNAVDRVFDYFEDNYVGRFRVNASRGTQRVPSTCFYLSSCVLEVSWSLTKGGNCCQSGNFTKWSWSPTSSTKKKMRWLQPAILRIVDDFPNRQRIDYLRSIAHSLAY